MGLPILPDPLPTVGDYHRALARLESEIAGAEKMLSRLRRERGCRLMQLADLQGGEVSAPADD